MIRTHQQWSSLSLQNFRVHRKRKHKRISILVKLHHSLRFVIYNTVSSLNLSLRSLSLILSPLWLFLFFLWKIREEEDFLHVSLGHITIDASSFNSFLFFVLCDHVSRREIDLDSCANVQRHKITSVCDCTTNASDLEHNNVFFPRFSFLLPPSSSLSFSFSPFFHSDKSSKQTNIMSCERLFMGCVFITNSYRLLT